MRRIKVEDLRLYLVTDRRFLAGRALEDVVMQAVQGGVTMVQLREKECSTREFVELGFRLKSALAPFRVPLIINDRVDVALACDADGVHLGQNDMPCDIARNLIGPDKILGLSVENLADVDQAAGYDVDYIGVSPVFLTGTKTDTAAAFGLEGLAKVREMSCLPMVGIGGMNLTTSARAIAAGADGVAVISAIMGAALPRSAAVELLREINRGLSDRTKRI